MKQAIIALGSNLDQPQQKIKQAIETIANLADIELLKASSLYLTKPVGFIEQADFINAVILIQTTLDKFELLGHLQQIEQQFGRKRSFKNAPRTLDLDLIDYNHETSADKTLLLPHPRAIERAFVMIPLAEITPDYLLFPPQTAAEIAQKLGMDGVKKI